MNLHKLIFTENACYKTGRKMYPQGIMLHGIGTPQPERPVADRENVWR